MNAKDLHPYQKEAVRFIANNKACALFLDMGLGKTISTLTAIEWLMYYDFSVRKTLVIAPKRVAQSTWTEEVKKWDHTRHLSLSVLMGNEKKRLEALAAKADIYVINRENIVWLVNELGNSWPFDMIVIDELSSFKSAGSKRFKALRKVRPLASRVVGLTGTPAPNGYMDLWSQIYLLDRGARLGKTITSYRQTYFTPGAASGHVVFNYRIKKGSSEIIDEKLKDLCLTMKGEDYISLPERISLTDTVILSEENMKRYRDLEKKAYLDLGDGEITASNAAALTGKLMQYAHGACYDENGSVITLHDEKVEALLELIEACTGNILLMYWFKHDLDRLRYALSEYDPKVLYGPRDIEDWNAGKVKLLLVHPASAGHGLNLQAGGSTIVWFSLTWSLELYQQANARLYRQGQQKPVIIHHLVVKGTIEEDVMKALSGKETVQESLLQALKRGQATYNKEQ